MPDEVSEDDLKILATSDHELIEQSAQFCFDRKEFSRRMRSGEEWQQLVQCQIYLEHVVDQLLRESIPFPEEVSFSRMAFRQRLDLARALDLIAADLTAAIRLLTKLRNNVAHNLSFEISEKDIDDLRNATPKAMRKAILDGKNREKDEIKFFELLEVILLMTELSRHHQIAARLLQRKSQIRLRTVLDQTPGAIYVR